MNGVCLLRVCCMRWAGTFLAGTQPGTPGHKQFGRDCPGRWIGHMVRGKSRLLFSTATPGVLGSLYLGWRKELWDLLELMWPDSPGGWEMSMCSKETPLSRWWCRAHPPLPAVLTWLTVDLGQHILNRVPIAPQAFGVRWGVAMAATPVSNVLGFKWSQVVKSWILLQYFL